MEQTGGIEIETAGAQSTEQWLPVLLLLFVGSGCAALIYEIVWFQLLRARRSAPRRCRSACCSARSWAACASAASCCRATSPRGTIRCGLRAPRARHRRHRPAAAAVVHAAGRPRSTRRGAATGVTGICCAARREHLPAAADAARWARRCPRSRAGSRRRRQACRGSASSTAATSPARSCGSLLAGFYLLRVYDMATATYVAAAINVAVGGLATGSLRRSTPADAGADPSPEPRSRSRRSRAWRRLGDRAWSTSRSRCRVLRALAAQVIWTRMLALLFGATIYTFSLILAVFLHRPRHRQQHRLGASRRRSSGRGSRSAGASCCTVGAMAWSGVHADGSRCRTGRSTRRSRRASGTTSSSISCAPLGGAAGRDSLGRQLSAGARVGGDDGARIRRASSAASTPPTRSARLSARSIASLRAGRLVRIAARAAGADDRLGACPACSCSRRPSTERDADGQGTLRWAGTGVADRWRRRCRASRADRAADSGHPRRLRPVRGDVDGPAGRHHLRRRRAERVGRRLALRTACCNYHNAGKVQASSEPQDMRLQRMLGHFTTLVPKIAEEGARDRLRRRRDRRRRQHRPERRDADDRRNRAARAAVVSKHFGEHNFNVVRQSEDPRPSSTMRGTIC